MLDQAESRALPVAEDTIKNPLHDDAMKLLASGNDRASKRPEQENPEEREQAILSALNGQPGKPAMHIPEGTNQLVVVTSKDWDDPTAHLQVFERSPQQGSQWHAAAGYSWPVNLGYMGMGWGAGGIIKTPEVVMNGQLERTGGPVEKADGTLDLAGHATMEGVARSTAGLFNIGLAWGLAQDAPAGTKIPYKHIDPFYRVIPEHWSALKDEQGRVLNGETVREIDAKTGKYERYDHETGMFVKGTLSPQVMQQILDNNQVQKCHLVIKDVADSSGNKLKGLLVKMNESEIPKGENGLPDWHDDMQIPYTSLDPKTGKPGPSGTLDNVAAINVFRESDFRWGDNPDRGHAVTGWDKSGKPILSNEIDNLYNVPLRIVDRASGEYERLDPDTGKPLHLGFMDPDDMQEAINTDEQMTIELYKWAMDVKQNVHQEKNRCSAIFIHDEAKNIEEGRPDGTEGCTSMSEQHMQELMSHLQKNAMILQCPLYELSTVVEALKPQ